MEQTNDEYLRALSTEQLEDLARRPDVAVPHQQVIRDELVGRYMLELAPRSPAPAAIGPAESGPATVPSRARRAGRSRRPLLAVAVVVVIAVIVLIGRTFVEHRESPAPPSRGNCDLGGGYACPLDRPAPIGQPCTCFIGQYRYTGVLR